MAMLGGVTLTSCNDFLDVEHPSEQDPAFVFSNTEDATLAINGVYAKFAEDPFTSRMSNVWMQNTDVETQTPSAGRPSGGHRSDLWGLQAYLDESFGDIYKAWNNCLESIEVANKVIKGIDESTVASNEELQQIRGEAVCLKAWRYLMMCNFWGDVPFYDAPAAYGQELDKARTDKNIIYSQCLRQLVEAEPRMKFSDVNTGGIERMNRDFCMGLIAKMALFRAGYGMTADGTMKKADDYLNTTANDSLAVTYTNMAGAQVTARTSADFYQLAKDYCQKLIQLKGRELTPSYRQIFDNEVNRMVPTGSPEVLYEVAFLESKGGDVGWCIGVTNTNAKTKGNTTNQVGINPIYYMSFADHDVRRDVTCSRFSHDADTIKVISGPMEMNVAKWDRFNCPADLGAGSSKGTGINWPLMRYSDVLLMLAEAENELNGPTALAKEQLTKVRTRAFAGSPTFSQDVTQYVNDVAASKAQFFEAIVNERAWEFGGECIRKWDLVRWNNYGTVINNVLRQLNAWGLAMTPELVENLPALAAKYPEYTRYLNWAPKLYYTKVPGTQKLSELQWLNDRLSVSYDLTAGKDSISWGDKVLKTVTTYIYNGKEYSDKPVKATAADGTVTYTLSDKTVVTATKDADGGTVSGITKRMTYQASDYATRIYRGYTGDTGQGTGAVPYLMPIGTTTLSTSAMLNNAGYCFGYDGEGTNVILGTVESPYK